MAPRKIASAPRPTAVDPAAPPQEFLSAEDAQLLRQAIEDVERCESDQLDAPQDPPPR